MDFAWVVPVIAVAVWILSSLIRPEEQPRRPPVRPRRFPDGGGGPDQPTRPLNEVDRFLQEIENLRKKADVQPQAEEYAAAPPPPARPPLPPKRLPVEVVVTETLPVPVNLPSSVPSIKAPRPLVEILDVLPVAPPVIAAPSVPARRPTPAAAQLQVLFRSPQSLRAALLAQAVLGPPTCRKNGF